MRFRDHHESCHGGQPTHPEGIDWAHVMVLHDGSTVFADSAAEVLAELLPGYQDAGSATQLELRIRHARLIAELVQRMLVRRGMEEEKLDPANPQQAALIAIMDTDKGLSLGLELPDAPGRPADWLPDVPLVLLTTSYAPHTAQPPIGGNVIWIDPTNEVSYLASLGATGAFDYWTSA